MSKKYSSYKSHQLITENWRKFVVESPEEVAEEKEDLSPIDEAEVHVGEPGAAYQERREFDPQSILVELEAAAESIGMHGDAIDRLATTDSDVWKVGSELFAVSRALQAVTEKLSNALGKPRTR